MWYGQSNFFSQTKQYRLETNYFHRSISSNGNLRGCSTICISCFVTSVRTVLCLLQPLEFGIKAHLLSNDFEFCQICYDMLLIFFSRQLWISLCLIMVAFNWRFVLQGYFEFSCSFPQGEKERGGRERNRKRGENLWLLVLGFPGIFQCRAQFIQNKPFQLFDYFAYFYLIFLCSDLLPLFLHLSLFCNILLNRRRAFRL